MVSQFVRFARFARARSFFAFATALVLAFCLIVGCSSDAGLAAKCDSFTITEQEVTDYTASFRSQNGLSSDNAWQSYLISQSYDEKTWREEAIRTLAERKIIEARAEELGITPDQQTVEQAIRYYKDLYSIESDQAWKDFLSGLGMTEEEFRANCEFASIEQQVLSADLGSKVTSSGAADQYIKSNMMDKVTRKFSVLSFTSESDAKAALAELESLSGDARIARFDEMAEEQNAANSKSEGTTIYSGNLGWDILYSTDSVMNGDDKIKLQPGDLYDKVVDAKGVYQIYLCTGRFVFESGTTFASIPDEDLKNAISSAALSSTLATEVDNYLNEKVAAANIQVYAAPTK